MRRRKAERGAVRIIDLTNIGRLYRTLRYLKARQLFGRAAFRLLRPRVDLKPAPPCRERRGPWVKPAERQQSQFGARRFKFLNVARDIEECGWDSPSVEKLWRYNLHYFDDLNAINARGRHTLHVEFIRDWIQSNRPARGTGWEPYPTSLRIVNWIKWLSANAGPIADMQHSLAVQARWLNKHVESHLLGNHLFVNAKALLFAGLYFEGPEAKGWLQKGRKLIEQQLPEQVLSDGGQFELSPMYHALALEDVLDCLNILLAFDQLSEQVAELRQIAGKMLLWLRVMTHPDGTLGRFNDTAEGIAPSNKELERYAHELGVSAQPLPIEGITHLASSGYIRAARTDAVVLLDVARVGPDYLPAHAHADSLSFELSVHSTRFIVNGGTSCYGVSPQRQRERSTAAHSTVELAGTDSSEVWSAFRVGRRAIPISLNIQDWTVTAAHNGYSHLPGKPIHTRSWTLGDNELRVDDMIGPFAADAVSRFILAPEITLQLIDSTHWDVYLRRQRMGSVEVACGSGSLGIASYAPSFGVTRAVVSLEVTLVNAHSRVIWRWLARMPLSECAR